METRVAGRSALWLKCGGWLESLRRPRGSDTMREAPFMIYGQGRYCGTSAWDQRVTDPGRVGGQMSARTEAQYPGL